MLEGCRGKLPQRAPGSRCAAVAVCARGLPGNFLPPRAPGNRYEVTAPRARGLPRQSYRAPAFPLRSNGMPCSRHVPGGYNWSFSYRPWRSLPQVEEAESSLQSRLGASLSKLKVMRGGFGSTARGMDGRRRTISISRSLARCLLQRAWVQGHCLELPAAAPSRPKV